MVDAIVCLMLLAIIFLIKELQSETRAKLSRIETTVDSLCKHAGLKTSREMIVEKLLSSDKIQASTMSWKNELFSDYSLVNLLPHDTSDAVKLVRKRTGMTNTQAKDLVSTMVKQLSND